MQRTSLTAEEIAAGLERARRNGQGWMACCPAHYDHNPSLSLTDGEGGRTLLYCHAGCPQDDVIEALRQRGLWQKPEAELPQETTYTYRHANGTPAFHVHRTDYPDGSKKIMQRLPGGPWKAPPPPRPLFNLPDIIKNPDAPVLVVEGEKTALAAAKRFPVGWVVTTSASGSNAAKQSDWSVLKDRDILVWPDNDPPGHKYAEDVKRLCEDTGARRVVIFSYPDNVRFPVGWDLADPLPEGFRMPESHELKDAAPQPQTSRGFTFTPWSEASEEPEEQIAWVVEDMLPVGGFSMLVAKSKAGKSTTVQCLAAAVVQGKPFLGRAVQQGRVAYVALEEKRSEVIRHFRQMGLPRSALLDIHTEPTPEQALTRLREYIEEQKPVLVIIDHLFLFVRFKDGNDYAEAVNRLAPVRALARETGCHLLVTHHAKKRRGAGGDEVLGSTGFFGAVDCLLSIKKSEATQQRTCSSIQRYGTDLEEVVLKLDAETRWVDIAGTKAEVDAHKMGEDILAFLGEQDEPVTRQDIEDSIEGRTKAIRAVLTQLANEGRIERSGRGKKGDPYHYFLCSRDPQKGVPESTDCEEKTEKDGNNNLSNGSGALRSEKMLVPLFPHIYREQGNKKVKRPSRSTSRG